MRKGYDDLLEELERIIATKVPAPPQSHEKCSHAIHGNAGKVARAKCRRRRKRRNEVKRAA